MKYKVRYDIYKQPVDQEMIILGRANRYSKRLLIYLRNWKKAFEEIYKFEYPLLEEDKYSELLIEIEFHEWLHVFIWKEAGIYTERNWNVYGNKIFNKWDDNEEKFIDVCCCWLRERLDVDWLEHQANEFLEGHCDRCKESIGPVMINSRKMARDFSIYEYDWDNRSKKKLWKQKYCPSCWEILNGISIFDDSPIHGS